MEDDNEALIQLRRVGITFPSDHETGQPKQQQLNNVDLTILPPTSGGHALLGRNGRGKTLISSALQSLGRQEQQLHAAGDGNNDECLLRWITRNDEKDPKTFVYLDPTFLPRLHLAHVSFESHQALLDQGGTTYKVLTGGRGGNLTKAAQFLVVRFGLFPLLHRDVGTLSTGEIRKVLLVRALATRPRLLILDNAFDGLDVPSRAALQDIVSCTIQGFRTDLLVQGVSATHTARTQVLLLTHRVEELVPEIATVSFFDETKKGRRLITHARGGDYETSEQLFARALNLPSTCTTAALSSSLPSVEEVESWWSMDRSEEDAATVHALDEPLIRLEHVRVQKGEATLLQGIDWTIRSGEAWLVAGGNGAGKSSLSRVLAKRDATGAQGSIEMMINTKRSDSNVSLQKRWSHDDREVRSGVAWVSTELHMATARSSAITAQQVLEARAETLAVAETVAQWLGLGADMRSHEFRQLSQGEQKLVLIAAALASRPSLLVLDEPCQGLDLCNRELVLGLVERLCDRVNRRGESFRHVPRMSLIYITHHMEEMIPSVQRVLHLSEGRIAFSGNRSDYQPADFEFKG